MIAKKRLLFRFIGWNNLGTHLQELFKHLAQTYGDKRRSITVLFQPSDIDLSLDQAMPCALVINELASNAYKHGFVKREKGTIEVSVERGVGNTVRVRVKDDGIGIPEAIDIETPDTLGLKLARNLVRQQLTERCSFSEAGGWHRMDRRVRNNRSGGKRWLRSWLWMIR